MKSVTSFRNPAVRRYRSLRDPHERRATGLAQAEGTRMLREALLSRADLVQVFLSDRARDQPGTEDIVVRLEAGAAAGRWECFTVPEELLARMASTENAPGALSIFRPRSWSVGDVLEARGPVVLLERLADPGNLGLILRTAEAAGAGGVIVSPGTADPLNPKTIRASAGSVFRLPVAREPLETAAAGLEQAGFRLWATSPHGGADYTSADLSGKVGFLLGQEGEGLSTGMLERFEGLHIPTGRVESLNVAMAAGILLYEALRQRR